MVIAQVVLLAVIVRIEYSGLFILIMFESKFSVLTVLTIDISVGRVPDRCVQFDAKINSLKSMYYRSVQPNTYHAIARKLISHYTSLTLFYCFYPLHGLLDCTQGKLS